MLLLLVALELLLLVELLLELLFADALFEELLFELLLFKLEFELSISTAAPPVELELDTLPDEPPEDEDTFPDEDDETLPDDDTLPDELLDPPLEVDEITMLPLDPPPPPPKKPPPKPPPPKKPPPPPTTTGTAPPPPTKPSPIVAGIGTGAAFATVTTAGGQMVVRVMVLITRRVGRTVATWRRTTRFTTCFDLTSFAGRSTT